MSNNYYILQLDDPATPGFCSFNKMYVGTEDTIKLVANKLEEKKYYPETVEAIRSYFSGNHSAVHNVAYRTQKVLVPIKVQSEHKTSFGNKKWTHINIWGFPYEMKCDSAVFHQIAFEYKGQTFRFIRAWLKNLCYNSYDEVWSKLNGGFWGNESVLDVSEVHDTNDFVFNNLLYVEEECYDNGIQAAITDMLNDEKLNLKKICDEIFADG